MGLFKKLIILALILGLGLIALKIILPLVAWAFQLAITLILLGMLGFAIIYLYQKLRT